MTPSGVRLVTERGVPGDLPIWTHPEWEERFPWLAQGVTSGGAGTAPFDLGLFGATPVGEALARWRRLREGTGFAAIAHSRQVHENRILVHERRPAAGLLVAEGYDGHLTAAPGLLLTASVADCVPVSVIDAETRAVAVVHAGWRGVVGQIMEGAIGMLLAEGARTAASIWVHCGPAICGDCYEVGPEVHKAVYAGREPPAGPTPIDLRAALAERAVSAGVAPAQVSTSTHCTRCGTGGFFSHRGGSPSRQMAFVGIRDPG
ncbi:MAG: polyphenol oxidase family protein [Gemmatimonadetes bacterium]|nr:polyphenol oxidase family protein [Gemmatimonadota bacterium]